MRPLFSSLRDRVVVITGASSGIGRATALAFAAEGAALLLAARREEALAEAAQECQTLGARAIAVRTDVTDPVAVQALAQTALDRFGRIDVWINNAGVGLFGPFTNAAIDAHRRVIEVNLFGSMHGAASALPIFTRQGEGVLITNISVGGLVPTPYAAAYTASKFGLRGLMASLRMEFDHHPRIHVCAVFPAVVDTPGFQHGANVSGKALRPGSAPLLAPEKVARTLVQLAQHPRPEVTLGWPTRPAQAGYALAPRLTERVAGAVFRRALNHGEPAPRTTGNLFVPVRAGTGASGGWRQSRGRARPAAAWMAAGAAVAGVAWLATRSSRRGGT